MNLYESVKNNLKESSKEELVNSLINYLYDTYGDNFKLEDNVNGYTKNEEIYEMLVTQYLEEKPDISFVEWVKNIIDEPHGLLEVKVNDTVNEGEETSIPKVETFDTEDTGGHVIVGFGKLSDGTYYSISPEVICIWDTDWYKLHFEEPVEISDDSPIMDEIDHMITCYDYDTPQYKEYADQCIAMDANKASYCIDMEE